MMSRYLHITLLCLAIVWGGMGCAPVKPVGPTIPSGYFFLLSLSDTRLFLILPESPVARYLPGQADVVVQVRNAQGQPVDGVPVEFTVTGMEIASVTPRQAVTSAGQARALLQLSSTGVARVVARVEGMQQEVGFSVSNPDGQTGRSSP
jgi:hypothetical protein